MMNKIFKIWEKNGFEILIIACIIIIVFFALGRIGKKGTWSSSFYYDPLMLSNSRDYIISVPKESSGEIECRRVLRKIFNKPFNKARPNFLRNNITGGKFNLELDCFEPSLKLACEYNGAQHYKFIPYFHKNKEAFLNQKYRDEIKRRMCKDNNIKLIEVPYTTKVKDIEMYIKRSLRNFGYQV